MRICTCKRTIIIDIIIYLSINMSIIWSGLPTITNMIDVGSMVAIADSVVSGVVWYLAMSNQLAIQWVVYTGILMAMVMCFTSAAYVAVKTVDASVSFTGY